MFDNIGPLLFTMYLIFQFPFLDSRSFRDDAKVRLKKPYWILPETNKDFVRSFGVIEKRGRGGFASWAGENYICKANNALSFKDLQPFTISEANRRVFLKILFKRLFFDGFESGRFEVGIYVDESAYSRFSERGLDDLITYILNLDVKISGQIPKNKMVKFYKSGVRIAESFEISTTKQGSPREEIGRGQVFSLPPMITTIVSAKNAQIFEKTAFWGKKIDLAVTNSDQIFYFNIPAQQLNIPMWSFTENVSLDARKLRVHLVRLHSAREGLKAILRTIAQGELQISPRSESSNNLQQYLNQTTRHILSLEDKTENIGGSDTLFLAKNAIEYISPGESIEILRALENLDIRRNVFNKLEDFIDSAETLDLSENPNYPKVSKINDPGIKENLLRAIHNINIGNVDLSLFDLSRIFERSLKKLLLRMKAVPKYEVSDNDIRTLANMIRYMSQKRLIDSEHELELIRLERNKFAHELMGSTVARKELLKRGYFIADLCLKYILDFETREI